MSVLKTTFWDDWIPCIGLPSVYYILSPRSLSPLDSLPGTFAMFSHNTSLRIRTNKHFYIGFENHAARAPLCKNQRCLHYLSFLCKRKEVFNFFSDAYFPSVRGLLLALFSCCRGAHLWVFFFPPFFSSRSKTQAKLNVPRVWHWQMAQRCQGKFDGKIQHVHSLSLCNSERRGGRRSRREGRRLSNKKNKT